MLIFGVTIISIFLPLTMRDPLEIEKNEPKRDNDIFYINFLQRKI